MLRRSIALLLISAAAASPQGSAPSQADKSATSYARTLWSEVRGYLTKAAADTPDSLFSYKPTPEVRSFGEVLDHIAASQNGYCHLALGEKVAGGGNGTGAKTKAEVVEALRASNALCERAYAQGDQETALPAFERDKRSRLYYLLENATHDNEHYGNIVTYLRLNHRVPPSSLAPMPGWLQNATTQAEVRVFILDRLFESLPRPPFTDAETEDIAARVYDYVWQRSAKGQSLAA